MTRKSKLAIRQNFGFILSCGVMALGIALVTNSGLGTTPITSLPYVGSVLASISLGATTFILNLLFLAGQKLLLGKYFTRFHLLQIPGVLIFSLCINLWMWATAPLISEIFICQLLMVIGGSAILGLGISLELVSKATVQPGEGILIAVAFRTHLPFSRLKVIFDIVLVFLAASLSWLQLHQIVGLGLGTLVSAFITGPCVRIASRLTRHVEPFFQAR